MLWKINLNRTLVDKNLTKLFEAKIGEDRNHLKMINFWKVFEKTKGTGREIYRSISNLRLNEV